ncbi:MAG: DHH family phosphoesterase [Cyanobacteriota bacterium]
MLAVNNNVEYKNIRLKQIKVDNTKPVKNARQELSNLLFGKSITSSPLTFGWSQNIPQEEKQILDLLTDPSVKNVLVASHSRPDGDAYGSNLGICGILESLNKNVQSVIDYKPANSFAKMPSAVPGKSAIEYIKGRPDYIKSDNFDVAVITDTPDPALTTDKVIDLLAKAKKIVIIDHHPEQLQKWKAALALRGVSEDRILYWRETRTSAAEMVGELDKEIVDESKKRNIAQYNPEYYHNYRLAIAGGIITDCGGLKTNTGDPNKIELARLSEKKVESPSGKLISATRAIFNWLINNSGVTQSKINMQDITRCSLPKSVDKKINDIMNGKVKVPGVEVKPSSKDDIFTYVKIDNFNAFNDLAKITNSQIKDVKVNGGDLYRELKKRLEEKIVLDKDVGFVMIVLNFSDSTILNFRSYGYNSLDGESYVPGHVFTNSLSKIMVDKLSEANLGEGGGHENATGFKLKEGVDFYKDVLPLVKKIIAEETKGKDLRKVPPEHQARVDELLFEKSASSVA